MNKPDRRDPMVKAMEAMAARLLRDMPNHPAAQRMQGVVNRIRQGAEALDNVNSSRSPLDTPAAHTLKVANMARKLDREITTAINQLGPVWSEAYRDAENRITEKVNLKPHPLANEIRTAFRAQNSKAQIKTLTELIDGNRGPELAAILEGPPLLTGLTEAQKDAFRLGMVQKHAGELLQEQESLTNVYEESMATVRCGVKLVKQLTDPGALARIEREAETANSASAAFNNSMQ